MEWIFKKKKFLNPLYPQKMSLLWSFFASKMISPHPLNSVQKSALKIFRIWIYVNVHIKLIFKAGVCALFAYRNITLFEDLLKIYHFLTDFALIWKYDFIWHLYCMQIERTAWIPLVLDTLKWFLDYKQNL